MLEGREGWEKSVGARKAEIMAIRQQTTKGSVAGATPIAQLKEDPGGDARGGVGVAALAGKGCGLKGKHRLLH